ncbi:MAG: phosphate ABC transporter permease PstA [Methyloceanibacter sp.]|uniref:phosphate ABC transporter permease PstA n=1 Tax=Methyloceanibacter sp. TaxID=1965321 RepID=UPI001D850360|nr:phosphate ABC transporter permease PstA [Methyloceanibacter sp.]MCB1442442.1 phosphate ABC transporter permease PstA [Methyloceanibacter sp.]MCC0058987.1 phosphate ABC transporter permease PstA [Hyphomicrobiaceae bacterium]
MTDQTASLASFTSEIATKKLRKRHRAERRFQMYGIGAILFALAFLVFLFASIFSQGWTAFLQTSIKLPIDFSQEVINPSGNPDAEDEIFQANYVKLAREALYKELGVDPNDRKDRRAANELLSRGVDVQLRDMVLRDPSIIGSTEDVWLLASDNADALMKGSIDRKTPSERRQVSDEQIAWIDQMVDAGNMKKRFNTGLFVNGASSNPETAGLGVALIGSFFMMLTVVLLAVPLGVCAALYLEEYAPKGKIADTIEVNINNLAAVPSIVFGLLGLAVFINFFGLPRSASLVGGLVLTLMTLPTIIITTRAAIRAVPPSIREAALGVGASKMQLIGHHILPLSLPGILTGTIIGLVQALGETAPLLMIGMVAFVVDYPTTPLEPATGLPVQIYMWASSAERGFVERTAGATIVLLAFLVVMNSLAVYLRNRFERKW